MSKYSLIFEEKRGIECQYKYIEKADFKFCGAVKMILSNQVFKSNYLINNEFITENSLQISFNV